MSGHYRGNILSQKTWTLKTRFQNKFHILIIWDVVYHLNMTKIIKDLHTFQVICGVLKYILKHKFIMELQTGFLKITGSTYSTLRL
jgi:hypothetical protein